MTLIEFAKKRHRDLYAQQEKWVTSCKDVRDFFVPMRGLFDGEQPNDGVMFDQKRIINSTPVRAARDLASGLTAGMTSPSHPWFELTLENKEIKKSKRIKLWLKQTQDLLYSVFRKSNTYTILDWLYLEFGSFGTGATMVLEDDENVIRYRNFTFGEYAIGVNSQGEIDQFARKVEMTVKQLVDQFGIDKVSNQVKTMYDNFDYETYIVVHYLIVPNEKRIPGAEKNSQNMKFLSLYWESSKDCQGFLSISGYEEFPILVPRWEVKNTTCAYGYGPGWKALGDAKMLQKLERDKLLAVAKINDPPIMLDSSVQGNFNRMPGGVTRFDATRGPNAGAKPAYQIDLRINEIELTIGNVERRIQKEFYTDLFLMVSQTQNRQRTATEVDELRDEKRILGPVLERMDHEILTPLITRVLNILARNGNLPEPPEEIQGQELTIEFVSVLAKAQKAVRSGTVEQMINFVANSAQIFPEAIDKIDIDKTIETYSEMTGVPPEIIRGKDEVEQLRNQRNQHQHQQQQSEQIAGAIQGAKTLSDTNIGEGNALDKIAEISGSGL